LLLQERTEQSSSGIIKLLIMQSLMKLLKFWFIQS